MVENSKSEFSLVDRAMFSDFSESELECYLTLVEKLQKNLTKIIEGEAKNDEMV